LECLIIWNGGSINEESIDEYSICPEQINFNKMQVVNVNLKQPKTIFPGLGKLQYQNNSRVGLILRKIPTVE
jgi:hypothetical protein